MSGNVKNAVDAYLDRVASSLPLEKRAGIRSVQVALTRGTHLPRALRQVYGMTVKEASDLARGIVKDAGVGTALGAAAAKASTPSPLGGVAGALGGAAGASAGKALGQAVSSRLPNVSGAVNRMTGGRSAPYMPSVAGARSLGRSVGSALGRMAKAGAEGDEDDAPEFPHFAQESMKTFTGPFSKGQSFLSSH